MWLTCMLSGLGSAEEPISRRTRERSKSAPIGRTTKPAPNVANDSSNGPCVTRRGAADQDRAYEEARFHRDNAGGEAASDAARWRDSHAPGRLFHPLYPQRREQVTRAIRARSVARRYFRTMARTVALAFLHSAHRPNSTSCRPVTSKSNSVATAP